MANASINLFEFYRRYKWTDTDFAEWQEGMIDHSRGMFEGLFNSAVLSGLSVAPSAGSDLAISVDVGLASGPSGYLHVIDEVSLLEFEAPTGDLESALVVLRPDLEPNTYIQKPTSLSESVPLKIAQKTEILIVRGTESATPAYPSKEVNDVILAGLRLYPGQTSIETEDIDLEVREIPGKNTPFQQNFGKYDDRFRSYIVDEKTIGIKPSQLEPPYPRAFSYVNKQNPSIFPKDSGGLYNGAAGDTFIDLEAGTISGADEASASFTPIIPSSGNAIVLYVGVAPDDTLSFQYGTEGTFTQCYEGIINQKDSGAGSVALTEATKPLAFVIAYSDDGAALAYCRLFDARDFSAVGSTSPGLAGGTVEDVDFGDYPITLDSSRNGNVILLRTSSGAVTINLPPPTINTIYTFKDIEGSLSTNAATLVPDGGGNIEGVSGNFTLDADYGVWNIVADGSNWWFI